MLAGGKRRILPKRWGDGSDAAFPPWLWIAAKRSACESEQALLASMLLGRGKPNPTQPNATHPNNPTHPNPTQPNRLQERFDAELEERISIRLGEARKEKAKKAEAALRERRMSSWCSTEEEEVSALEEAQDVNQMLVLAAQRTGPTFISPKIDEVLARALAKSLFRDSYILQLDVSECAIGDESAAYIARSIRKNK
eukprot:scaffold770_cov255-Pinguiococcus_pyrenoidosus.AAC.10